MKGINSMGGYIYFGSGFISINGEYSYYIEVWNGIGVGGNKMLLYVILYRVGGSNINVVGNYSYIFFFGISSVGDYFYFVGIGVYIYMVVIGLYGYIIIVNSIGNIENMVKNIVFNYIVCLV